MKRRFLKGIVLVISVAVLFSAFGVSAYAAKEHQGNKGTKNVLIKYVKEKNTKEDKFKEKNGSQKSKGYRRINQDNLYSFEVETSEYEALLQDSEIELVEEDAEVRILSEIDLDSKYIKGICSICGKELYYNKSIELKGLSLVCHDCSCNHPEEHTTIENSDARNVPLEGTIDETPCGCPEQCKEDGCCENGECSQECILKHEENEDEVSEDEEYGVFWNNYVPCCDICNYECVNNPCCESCIFADIYYRRFEIFTDVTYIEAPKEALQKGNSSEYNADGDELSWNIIRT